MYFSTASPEKWLIGPFLLLLCSEKGDFLLLSSLSKFVPASLSCACGLSPFRGPFSGGALLVPNVFFSFLRWVLNFFGDPPSFFFPLQNFVVIQSPFSSPPLLSDTGSCLYVACERFAQQPCSLFFCREIRLLYVVVSSPFPRPLAVFLLSFTKSSCIFLCVPPCVFF